MNAHKPVRALPPVFVLLTILWWAGPPVEATPASGVSFTLINRATVAAFDARRKYQEMNFLHPRRENWKIELEATRMIDIVTVLFTVQPGGQSGWHTHPGPALFTISAGALTMYDADDPSCTPKHFPAGTGSIEADTAAHSHLLRNETSSVAQTIVTFLVPVGTQSLRSDRPDPGFCVF